MHLQITKDRVSYFLIFATTLFFGVNYLQVNNLFAGIFSFLFLSIVPGFLFYRLLFKRIEFKLVDILYYVGLSIFLLLFIGLGINTLFPLIGISKPLTLYPLLYSFTVSTFLLSILDIFFNSKYQYEIVLSKSIFRKYGFLSTLGLILLLSVMGAISLNNFGSNIWTMAMLLIIALYVIYMYLIRKKTSDSIYAISIFCISLAILLMLSLRSWHITGWDINEEYEVFQVTKAFGHWSIQNIRHDYNTCLSITLLPTIFSRFFHIPDEYIYKVIYQIYFALVPTTMYFIFRKFANKLLSFLSVFYFVAQPFFIQPMTELIRQETAFLFFSLFILTLFSNISKLKKELLLVIFGLSMVVSHYSTAYIAVIFFILTYMFSAGFNLFIKHEKKIPYMPFKHHLVKYNEPINRQLSLSVIVILLVATVAWFSLLNKNTNSPYAVIIQTFSNINSSFQNDLKSTDVSQTISIFSSSNSVTSQKDINAYTNPASNYNSSLYYPPSSYSDYKPTIFTETLVKPLINTKFNDVITNMLDIVKLITKLFILLGSIYFVIKYIYHKHIRKEYIFVVFIALASVLLFMLLPDLSIDYNLTRLYMQALIVLALPGMAGGLALLKLIFKKYDYICLLSIIVIYFLYLSGFLTNIFGGQAYMQLDNFGDDYEKFYTFQTEVQGAEWLSENRDKHLNIFADEVSNLRLFSFGFINSAIITIAPKAIEKNAYVYLRYENIHKQRADATYLNKQILYFSFPVPFLEKNKDLIYNNGGSEVFH
jgi:uncharacterized membrane protein